MTNSAIPVRIAVLASGNGSNLQAIIDAALCGYIRAEPVAVLSNKRDSFALERARRHGIEPVYIDPAKAKDEDDYSRILIEVLRDRRTGLVCLAGFIPKLSQEFIKEFHLKVMNIHPALLPRFGGTGFYGMRVHRAVIEAREKESGATVHFVDEIYDHGPIIIQAKVPVYENDTAQTLAERVLKEEHRIYPEAIRFFAENRLKVEGNKVIIIN